MNIPAVCYRDSITLHFPDGTVFVPDDHEHFEEVYDLVAKYRGQVPPDEVERLRALASPRLSLQAWAQGDLEISERGQVSYRGTALPGRLNSRIIAMRADGGERWKYLVNFWIRLQRNPSRWSQQQLYLFLENKGIPIGPEGYFYCYKGVRDNYLDNFSRTFNNRPGNSHWLPRDQVSDNPTRDCDVGLHAGNMAYAKNYGTRMVICRVDPANVARVQEDGKGEKIGIAAYSVVADATDVQLPSLTWDPGEDQYAKNYRTPEDVFGSYGVWLLEVPTRETGRIIEALGSLGMPAPIARALLKNLPACVLGEVGAEEAKAAYQCLTPGHRVGTENCSKAEVRGMPLELLDAAPVTPASPTPARVEKTGPDDVLADPSFQMPATGAKTVKEAPAPAPVPAPAPGHRPDLASLGRTELRAIAKGLKIPRYSKPGAAALRTLIQDAWLELENVGAVAAAPPASTPALKEARKDLLDTLAKVSAPVEEPVQASASPADERQKHRDERYGSLGRAELRTAVSQREIPFASKLGVNDLRALLTLLDLKQLSAHKLREVKRKAPQLRELIRESW